MILKEDLEKRHASLVNGVNHLKSKIGMAENDLARMKSDLETTSGALQECEFWLAHVEELAKDNHEPTA